MPARKPLSAAAAAFLQGGEPAAAAGTPPPPAAPVASSPAPEPEARVRFTVDLPRSLHKRLKLAALERDEPMTDLARQALAEWLEGQA